MSLKHIDIEGALRRVADRRIEEAMREGKFDNLAGAGKPLNLEDPPADEGARLMWWALRILKQNDVIPEEVQWRKRVDLLRQELAGAKEPARRGELIAQMNELIKKINTLGTNAISIPIAPVTPENLFTM